MSKKLLKLFNFSSISVFFLFAILFIVFPFLISASSSNGTVDNVYKYVWGSKTGWINFGPDQGNVRITDYGLTGYIWSANYGWIILNPENGGIRNDEGVLRGYAWGQNLGWIDFSNVKINSTGEFTGYASGTVAGIINFGCERCLVKTDWRPASIRPGAELPEEAFGAPAPPLVVVINNGEQYTLSNIVNIQFNRGADTERVIISNRPDFSDSAQESYASAKQWDLCAGRPNEEIQCPAENTNYNVYVKFYTKWGQWSEVFSDSIIFVKEIPKKPITKRIYERIYEKLPVPIKEIIPPGLRPQPPLVRLPLEEAVAKLAPVSLKGKWILIDPKAINRLVFAPLPKEFGILTQKIPQLYKTFSEVGVTRFSELEKLRTARLILPGLTQGLGLPAVRIEPGKIALPEGVPISKLPALLKQKIPSEIVFARTGGELIDFNAVLSISEKGKPQQKISTIVGRPLELILKPEQPVKTIRGYVVFKSKNPRQTSMQIPLKSLKASLLFANPIFVQNRIQPVEIEEKLVLMEFEYSDADGDGIYIAEIPAPLVEGEYEIISVMDYQDPSLGMKEIKLITVIDPEGYIYEKEGDMETRIPGAIAYLYWLNSETKQYELWPAKAYQQENPQTTDVRGTYSFIVPEGYYYLKVEAPGFLPYDGKPFEVKEGKGIHINIEMKSKYWMVKIVDWKTLLLIGLVMLLLYNFYRDKVREKSFKSD